MDRPEGAATQRKVLIIEKYLNNNLQIQKFSCCTRGEKKPTKPLSPNRGSTTTRSTEGTSNESDPSPLTYIETMADCHQTSIKRQQSAASPRACVYASDMIPIG